MLSNYIEQLFKLDNYYDGLIVTDNKGYIEFFMTYRPDISGAKQEDLVGKHVLDIYTGIFGDFRFSRSRIDLYTYGMFTVS